MRMSPHGTLLRLLPFHVCMECLQDAVLCRDEEDYDALVKILAVCAFRKDVIIVIYVGVSNHCHLVVLAGSQADADAFGAEVKRMYAMWFSRKYGERGVMRGVTVSAIWLDTDWYVRNALAYVPRNALDNGCDVTTYPWSGFRAMFQKPDQGSGRYIRVASLTTRECERIMHTCDDLRRVPWLLDDDLRLVPGSFCDHEFLEQAFDHDQAFFLKVLGGQNPADLKNRLIDAPRTRMLDDQCYKAVSELSRHWFRAELKDLSLNEKIRLLPYIYRTMKTSVPQLARVFGLSRDQVSAILRPEPRKPGRR